MTVLIIVIAIALAIVAFIDTRLKTQRQILLNELSMAYDRMELFLVKNKEHPNSSTVEFLKRYKFLLANPGLADIRIMFGMLIAVPDKNKIESRDSFEKLKQHVNPELINVAHGFTEVYNKLISHSCYKFSFILFMAKIVIYVEFLKLVKKSREKAAYIKKEFKEVLNSENLLPTTYKMAA